MLYFYGKKHNETEGPAMIKIAIVEDEAAVRDQLTDVCAPLHPPVRHRV